MSMKSKLLVMAAMAMASMNETGHSRMYHSSTPETDEERAKRLAENEKKLKLSQGLREFDFNGKKIWALNQKSANRKAKKLGLN